MANAVKPQRIRVTRKQYFDVKKLKNPSYEDYKNTLGEKKALQIVSLTFHEIPVQIIASGK